jgi:hypothetical protein
MKICGAVLKSALLFCSGVALFAQDKAAIQMDKQQDVLKVGGPIAFTVKLNEPLPKGARFDVHVSPVSADEDISLSSPQASSEGEKTFRVSGNLPAGAVPGEWHVTVVWLFLPGTGWTHNRIETNNVTFHVGGKPYAIPTKAEITVDR